MTGYEILGAMILEAQDDRYNPDTAACLLRGLKDLDDDSARVSIKLFAMDAQRKVEQEVN